MSAPIRLHDTPALIAARERASYGVADEADAALLSESRHGTDRILARNTLAAIEADRILTARGVVIPDAPYAIDVEPEDDGDGGMVVAALVAITSTLVVAALIVFAAAAAHSAFVAAGGF